MDTFNSDTFLKSCSFFRRHPNATNRILQTIFISKINGEYKARPLYIRGKAMDAVLSEQTEINDWEVTPFEPEP